MATAVVTGASGFIGSHLVPALQGLGWMVVTPERGQAAQALAAADTVFHLAGMAHANAQGGSEQDLLRVNVEDTLTLYRQSVAAGVGRFIWLSSIKALGDVSDRPFTPNDTPAPGDAYGHSKAAAEAALLAEPPSDTALHIVRPPLVYGPGVKANFLSLIRFACSPWPLPLAGATAPRAWVGVNNLIDLLLRLASDPAVASAIWHVRDAEQTSVRDMLLHIGDLWGRRPRLFALPEGLLMAGAGLLDRRDMAQRLLCPLQVDMQATQSVLGWQPPLSQMEELTRVVTWYRTQSS